MPDPFVWVDGERTIHFGPAADAVSRLGGPGYTLLTTPRAAAAAPWIVAAAGAVHDVGAGQVHELAGALLGVVTGERIVALGGGRVVDVAKALAAASKVRAMAVPTTLSGAEMTSGHRHAVGVDEATPRVRPAVVVFDPALAASQPLPELAASSLNALGHAVEGPCTVKANPVATLAAHEAARLLAAGWAPDEPDRETLALGALLAGYVIDSTGLGLHHVLAQTLVRVAGAGHGAANAAVLPHTIAALARRKPDEIAAFGDVAGLARRLQVVAGAVSLEAIGVDAAVLPACADAAAARPQLANTPPAAGRDEILAIYEAAL
ncbi:iron-containing alcohol dehydrogenase [Solirubrobacter ginsenosidimutans]|uniref:Iron-containing alcohol dehydrogenase n=1 Tax=Solirubrobacter ginsenosidimutans TaxID=490573 RepID=A0A9X3N2R3_9ACTN|nr:iron-containing alcohol dehydrogenase [Solirubrobacter ginsenosidimutans]MDA0165607.1 iron-containing alcohol dehydrogenase [Solirubrobacter ginsenosidimutans]